MLTVDNQLDCLVRLQLGLADAVFTDNALAAGQAAQDPSMHLVGRPVTPEPYGVAMNLDATPIWSAGSTRCWTPTARAGRTARGCGRTTQWLAADLPGITGPPPPQYK